MPTPLYPTTLPLPKTVNLSAAEQRLSSPSEDPYETRRITFVPGAVAAVTFKFLNGQFKQFREWYVYDLIDGHKWFSMKMPSAVGLVNHIVRFTEPPQEKLLAHRHWEVSATLEVRERIFDNRLLLTSRPYSIEVEESIDNTPELTEFGSHTFAPERLASSASITHLQLRRTNHYLPIDGTAVLKTSAAVQSIELRDVRKVHQQAHELFKSSATVQSITMDEVTVYTQSLESLKSSATVLGITLT